MKQNIFRKVSRFVPVLVAAVAVTGCDAHIDVPDTAVRPGHVLCEDGTALSYTEYQQSGKKAVAVVFDTRQHEGAEGNGYAVYLWDITPQAFAVAINIDPEILIVDEALSVGDVFFQAKCYRKFEDFKKEGKTILFVSHDLGSITKYCDRAILLNQGEKIFEGTPKEAVDIYKKVLVHQFDPSELETDSRMNDVEDVSANWKDSVVVNPKLIEYGEKIAEITDYAILDDKGLITNTLMKGSTFSVRMKVDFHEEIKEPIYAFTIKNLQGIEITGTNTMYEKADVKGKKEGESQEITFTQKLDLQGGEYLISLGCTGYRNGEFVVFHRLYDVCSLTVISDRNTVGYYDMNSKVTLS